MRNKNHFRQGDVYFARIDDYTEEGNIIKIDFYRKEGYTKVEPKNGSLILAYGEVTGHNHSINLLDYPDVELFEKNGDMLLNVPIKATLTHQEHLPVILTPGKYEVYIQEEYDPEGMRKVQD